MDDKIVATFCLCDDLLKAIHHHEDGQCQMNDAEIMTTALIAALCFRGKHESARAMLKEYGYIPHMLSKSRFSRRLHRSKELFILLFQMLGNIWKTMHTDMIYVIDSLPVSVCDNIRIRRSKIYGSLVIPGVYIPLRNKGNTVSEGDRRMCRSGHWATLHILQ